MASASKSERFVNAVIDAKDRTITEVSEDGMRVYSIDEFIKRWSGISGVTLLIAHEVSLPPDGRDDE